MSQTEIKIGAVILAAGAAKRFGKPKQLERWPTNGPTFVELALQNALAVNPSQIVVVTGNATAEVTKIVMRWAGLHLLATNVSFINVFNARWEEGQGFSVAKGVQSLGPKVNAALFFLCDQPRLSPTTGAVLAQAFLQNPDPHAIIFPTWEGKRGNPVLFGRTHWEALSLLEGDVGGRAIVKAHPEDVQERAVNDPAILEDVDTPEDLARIEQS